ncbi:hypothetical protein [Pseudoalteromonas ardens]|uniref:Uncharacterized protein n=1 Tax=Pseudoalteromonas rubra TaxID=43658 RepID=A0A0L0ERF7_9GAMM|nr:hypothetical protein [Pseudoalteromonas sp. R96]KNC66483.1 hypothetical protein AC626_16670 [Pseudoalteromonas rubra]MDK1313196.1 hypothetical protein [Pseudoalteromonas sp. R96]
MELIYIGGTFIVMALIFVLAMLVKGAKLTSFEKRLKALIIATKEEEEEVENKYSEAYEIVMEFGDLLAAEKNLEQYYGVKDIYDRVEEFRAENNQTVEKDRVILKVVK